MGSLGNGLSSWKENKFTVGPGRSGCTSQGPVWQVLGHQRVGLLVAGPLVSAGTLHPTAVLSCSLALLPVAPASPTHPCKSSLPASALALPTSGVLRGCLYYSE